MKAVVIFNPAAGSASRRRHQLANALTIFKQASWTVSVCETSAEGHAPDLAREAITAGADVVVAAGGDGTVNEVLQGVVGTDSALGVLPMGTANVWAREAGFSSRVITAAQQLVMGTKVALDVGRIGSHYFLLMAGIGLDAEVTVALGDAKRHKQRLGVLPYIVRLVSVVPRYQGTTVDLEVDGELQQHRALMVLVSNTRLYGGVRRPNRHAIADDGALDVRIFPGTGVKDTVKHLVRFALDRQESSHNGNLLRTDRIIIRAEPPAPVQVDGDPIGNTPVEILVEHQALNVLLSPSYDRALLGKA